MYNKGLVSDLTIWNEGISNFDIMELQKTIQKKFKMDANEWWLEYLLIINGIH